MNKEQVLSLVRSFLKVAGTYFVTSGVITDAGLEQVIGGVLVLAGIAWSHFSKKADAPPA